MKNGLALYGGKPVRGVPLPYGKQWIDEEDVVAVAEVLRSDWLTTGPKVGQFETTFAHEVDAAFGVAVSSGTAALHTAAYGLAVGPGDEVIVPAITFAASANCVVYQGGKPVFADVEPDTLLIDPARVEGMITSRTKAIISVDYAGQPCNYEALGAIAARHGIALLADACHSLGGTYRGRKTGSLADLSVFSFHPVKHVTTGEGGMVTTDDPDLAKRMRMFRNHGITSEYSQREKAGSWFYEMVDLGYNYRLTDLQCALGLSQIGKLKGWTARRREIAREYDNAFGGSEIVKPLLTKEDVSHAYHLYVIRFDFDRLTVGREEVFKALRAEGIGINVHYIPVHLHPFYRERYGYGPGMCPVAEKAYESIMSIPMYPRMTDLDVEDVTSAISKVVEAYRK